MARLTDDPALTRTRWAALGAAVAVTLGGGGLWIADAAGDSDPSVFRSITPCRLADFRPGDFNVGEKASPLGPGETHTLDATGANGNCDVPTSATAIVANVTALNPTAPTNLRLYPADADLPTTSNLNPVPGQPPAPNAVTVGLDADGEFKITNAFGSVNVIVDLVGYYELPDFDDRYAGRDVTMAVSVADAVSIGSARPASTNSDECLFDGSDPYTLIIPVDVPVGATITAMRASVRSQSGSTSEYQLSLFERVPTALGRESTKRAGIIGVGGFDQPTDVLIDHEITPPTPVLLDPGEDVYVALEQMGNADHALCSLDVTYLLPEVSD